MLDSGNQLKKIVWVIGLSFGITACEADSNDSTTPNTGNNSSQGSTDWHDNCESLALAEGKLGLTAIYDEDGNKIPDSQVNTNQVYWTVLTSESHGAYSGVGRYGGCTGTLIETGGDSSSPAYVLTNGHCVGTGLLSAQGVTIDQVANSSKKMYFNYYLENGADEYLPIDNKTIKFASMDGTDVAVVELDATLGELKDQGITAFQISSTKPSLCTQARNVGVPLTGVSSQNIGLRLSDCFIGDEVSLNEGPYRFVESIRHRCSIVGGNSGSPIFNKATGSIIGVVNTAVNDDAASSNDCVLNKPCEVSSSGEKTVESEENYGQYVDFLAGCFSDGIFDIDLSSCGINAKFSL